jgi:5-methylthioadenosine/S-adenosylhomocysteine deaminase
LSATGSGDPRPLTVTGARLARETIGLRCENGKIAALGPEVRPAPGDETIDAKGAHLVEPLLNGHTHAAMTLFRGYGGDLPLMRWLREKVWPVEERIEADDVYWGTRLACVEMIRTGTTRFWDMYWHPGATARAVLDSGLRATIGAPLIDLGGDQTKLQEGALHSLEELEGFGSAIAPALAPHAIYTVGEESLRWIGELSAERDLPVQIHLSETEQEVSDCVAAHGERPAAYLDRVGLLGERTVLAHGVWLDRAELELIAERGCTVVANPVANMKLAVGGVFPYPAAREAEIPVAIGTDGAGSNDSLDLLADLKVFALAQRHASGDPTVLPAAEAWEIATGVRAPLLGGKALAVGAPADFLLLRRDAYEVGLGDLASDLVYAAAGSVVETTVVGGRVLMRGGEVPDAAEVVAQAAERAERLGIA